MESLSTRKRPSLLHPLVPTFTRPVQPRRGVRPSSLSFRQLDRSDQCCIDKSSSAELQEAINSMYRWYQNSVVCYAYLSDVAWHTSQTPEIGASLWFKRGWTLQELVAPKSVIFYSSDWSELGSRLDLAQSIRQNTRLPYRCLNGGFKADGNTPIAEIMSWARERETTRIEDRAYSLLGLFNVYMPMLYGEGVRAFTKLQEELLRQSGDQSIFAWEGISLHHSGLLADSPDCFPPFEAYDRCEKSRRRASSVTSEGITAEFILLPYSPHMHLAILNYELKFHNDHSFPSRKIYGIFLREVDHRSRFCRVHPRRKHLWTGDSDDLWHVSVDPSGYMALTMATVVQPAPRLGTLGTVEQGLHSVYTAYRVHIDDRLQDPRVGFARRHEVFAQQGLHGFLRIFQIRGPFAGRLRQIALGFDAHFSTICVLEHGDLKSDWHTFFERISDPGVSWNPLNSSCSPDNIAAAWQFDLTTLEGCKVGVASIHGALCLKVQNKLGLWNASQIRIDTRRPEERISNKTPPGVLELRLFGQGGRPPTDLEIGPQGFDALRYQTCMSKDGSLVRPITT